MKSIFQSKMTLDKRVILRDNQGNIIHRGVPCQYCRNLIDPETTSRMQAWTKTPDGSYVHVVCHQNERRKKISAAATTAIRTSDPTVRLQELKKLLELNRTEDTEEIR